MEIQSSRFSARCFYYRAVKDHLLAGGRIDAKGTGWLRQLLFADSRSDDQKRKLMHEIRGEAREVSPEFEALFEECMKRPPEPHTCG